MWKIERAWDLTPSKFKGVAGKADESENTLNLLKGIDEGSKPKTTTDILKAALIRKNNSKPWWANEGKKKGKIKNVKIKNGVH